MYYNYNYNFYPESLAEEGMKEFLRYGIPVNPTSTTTVCGTTQNYNYTRSQDKQHYKLEFCLEEAAGTYYEGVNIVNEKGEIISSTFVDTDKDGLSDYDEVTIYKTNPQKDDTDGDGFKDGDEVKSGYNPNGSGKLGEIKKVEIKIKK
jgi:hypothetical protein